jgi:carboxyl-terminal processing protease
MGLDKMYILTGSGTASASELTITGLKPYMRCDYNR